MTVHVEKLPVPPTQLGEGPHWCSRRQTLYYTSIMGYTIHRYVPATKEYAHTQVDFSGSSSSCHFIIPIADSDDLFLMNLGRIIYVIRWDGVQDSKPEFVKKLAEVDEDAPMNIVNDAKVDPRGRLFTGTIGMNSSDLQGVFTCIPAGSFCSVTSDGVVKRRDTGIACSNGIAYDVARKALYHVDSFAHAIRRFDYDVETGETSNKTILFDYKEKGIEGVPDGMALDTDGNLWVATFDGSCVLNINPDTAEVIRKIDIPDKQVASVNFGGQNMDVLFVTCGHPKTGTNPAEGYNGGIYAVTGLGVRGHECLPFKVTLKQ